MVREKSRQLMSRFPWSPGEIAPSGAVDDSPWQTYLVDEAQELHSVSLFRVFLFSLLPTTEEPRGINGLQVHRRPRER